MLCIKIEKTMDFAMNIARRIANYESPLGTAYNFEDCYQNIHFKLHRSLSFPTTLSSLMNSIARTQNYSGISNKPYDFIRLLTQVQEIPKEFFYTKKYSRAFSLNPSLARLQIGRQK